MLLALDCSTARGSVALLAAADGGVVIWQTHFLAGRGHGGKLFAALAEAMGRRHGQALTEIVVGLGPGSYSGVRQAIAVATGLAAATGARLTGVPSPLALETGLVAYQAVGDARRGAFYYTAVEHGRCVAGPELLANGAVLWECLAKHPNLPVLTVECTLAGDAFTAAEPALPSADRLPRSSLTERQPPPLEPIYLRSPAITLPAGAPVKS